MEPTDLTVRVLREIRDEVRGLRTEQQAFRETVTGRFDGVDSRFEAANTRFEAIETALRDMAEQLVILGRGVKVAIEQRTTTDARLAQMEQRIDAIEKRAP